LRLYYLGAKFYRTKMLKLLLIYTSIIMISFVSCQENFENYFSKAEKNMNDKIMLMPY
jgi:hypothetical protein